MPVLKIKKDGVWEEVTGSGTNLELDTTLTQSDQAAEAKSVGEALATKITAPSAAAVGQALVVKTIDDSGAPTEWECTDASQTYTQVDWNTLDHNSSSYIANKPFGFNGVYYENGKMPFKLEGSIYVGKIGTETEILNYDQTLAGEETCVTWDGTEYSIAVERVDIPVPALNSTLSAICVGNPRIFAEYIDVNAANVVPDNNLPFAYMPGLGTIMTRSELPTHSVIIEYKNLDFVKVIEAKYLPKQALQADWNQANAKERDYIRNKPVLVTKKDITNAIDALSVVASTGDYQDLKDLIVGYYTASNKKTTIKFNNNHELNTAIYEAYFRIPEINTGDLIKVDWDGTEYSCTAKQVQVSSILRVNNLIGNGRIVAEYYNSQELPEDTGEPFAIIPTFDRIYTRNTNLTHLIQIHLNDNVIKLDKKFLPADVVAQADWAQTDETAADFIKNKPDITGSNIVVSDTYDATSSNAMSGKAVAEALQTVSGGTGEGLEQVQVDWNQTDDTAVDFIKNKPTIPSVEGLATVAYVDEKFATGGASSDIILKEQIFEGFVATEDGYSTLTSEAFFEVIAGNNYQVAFDGNIYNLTAYRLNNEVWLGNEDAAKGNGNFTEPFVIVYIPDENSFAFMVVNGSTSTSHMIGITKGKIQVDWNETNTASSAYIKSKPFGEDVTYTDLLPFTIYSGFELHPNFPVYGKADQANYSLAIGESYTVFWDGVEYDCVAQNANAIITGCIALGNGSGFGFSGNNEPFAIALLPDHTAMYAALTDTEAGGTHTVRISEKAITLRKIDAKFLPASGGGGGVTSWNDLTDKPFYEYEGRIDVLKTKTHNDFLFNPSYGTYLAFEERSCDLIIGETYIVHWDGNEYECVAQDASALAVGAVLLGNATNLGLSGNNEPFIIVCLAGVGTQYFALTDTANGGSHIIGIAKEAILAHQIDKKYIPIPFFGNEELKLLDCTFVDTKDAEDNWRLNATYQDLSDCTPIVGDSYTVKWNGVFYECECFSYFSLPVIGNPVLVEGEDNGIPFTICRDITGTITGTTGWICWIIVPNDDGIYECTISGNTIKKVDTKYLYQPDWNENNKAKGSYITNRPFYSLDSGTIVLPETTVICSIQETETLYLCIMNQIDIMPAMYEVEFDGIIYSTNGNVDSTGGWIECNDDSGVACMIISQEGLTAVAASQGEHTIKITLAEEVVQKIDHKYLPDDIGGGSSLPEVTTSDAGKFLRVSSAGTWVAEAIPNAEEASF